MEAVCELKSESVLARFQLDGDSRLALAVVEMLFVGGNDLAGWDEACVDEDVEVSGAVVDFAGGLDDETCSRHHDFKG